MRETGRDDGMRWAKMQRDESGLGSSDDRMRATATAILAETRTSSTPERVAYEEGFLFGVEEFIGSALTRPRPASMRTLRARP